MTNMIDYLKWRGDLSMAADPFNAIDGLILSELSYFPWEEARFFAEDGTIVSGSDIIDKGPVPLSILESLVPKQEIRRGAPAEGDALLYPLVAKSPRFSKIYAGYYVHEFDENLNKQFSAITFFLPDKTGVIAYRGTDGTLVGWKEDFNMAFSEPVPAQIRAFEYLKNTMLSFTIPFRVMGHSKGGNLAMFAASILPLDLQKSIMDVYSYDSPGLTEKIFQSEGYSRIVSRLHSYVPQSSIIGMLLLHPEQYTVVCSDSVSILQHNPYNWHILQAEFITENDRKPDSVYIEEVLKNWLSDITEEQRRSFVDTLFDVLEATDSREFGRDLVIRALKNPYALYQAYNEVDEPTRQKFREAISALGSSSIDLNFPAFLHAMEHEPKDASGNRHISPKSIQALFIPAETPAKQAPAVPDLSRIPSQAGKAMTGVLNLTKNVLTKTKPESSEPSAKAANPITDTFTDTVAKLENVVTDTVSETVRGIQAAYSKASDKIRQEGGLQAYLRNITDSLTRPKE